MKPLLKSVLALLVSCACPLVVHAIDYMPPTSLCESVEVDSEKFVVSCWADENLGDSSTRKRKAIIRTFDRKGKLLNEKCEVAYDFNGLRKRSQAKMDSEEIPVLECKGEDGTLWVMIRKENRGGIEPSIVSVKGKTQTRHDIEWDYEYVRRANSMYVVGKNLYVTVDDGYPREHRSSDGERVKGLCKISLETFKQVAAARLPDDTPWHFRAVHVDEKYIYVIASKDRGDGTIHKFSLDTLEASAPVRKPSRVASDYRMPNRSNALVDGNNLWLLAVDEQNKHNQKTTGLQLHRFSLEPLELSASVKLPYRATNLSDMIVHDGKALIAGVREIANHGGSEIFLMRWDGVSDATKNQVLTRSIDYSSGSGSAPIHLANIGADALLGWTFPSNSWHFGDSSPKLEPRQQTFAFSLDFEMSLEPLDKADRGNLFLEKRQASREKYFGKSAPSDFPEEPSPPQSAPMAAKGGTNIDPDIEWLDNVLLSEDAFRDFEHLEELVVRLKDKKNVERLVLITRRFSAKNVNYDQQRAAFLATQLLAWTGTDEAVEAIAPYLDHPLPSVRRRALLDLRKTLNPKAAQYLPDALRDVESEKAKERLYRQALKGESETCVETFLILSRSYVPPEDPWGPRKESMLEAIAKNPNTPVKILDLLAESPVYGIPVAVAGNPTTSVETLRKLYKGDEWYAKTALSQNPNTPPDILAIFSEYTNGMIREYTASNPSTCQETLEKLAQLLDDGEMNPYSHGEVRSRVASNPSTSVELLGKLAQDVDYRVIRAVSKNPNLSKEDLEKYARHKDRDIRGNVASKPNISRETWQMLARDRETYVLQGIVANPNVSREELEGFIQSANPYARIGAARNPLATKEDLEKLVKDPAWQVRLAVLKNSNCSQGIKEQLRDDPHFEIQRVFKKENSSEQD